jgi:RsiW-degrading membrane proteinase PrsW (M82 family)
MSGFFEELQRRKVYRVAAAYIVAAGFLIQMASAAFPAWELPNWSLRLVIVLLLIGFPIALILAWAYEARQHVEFIGDEISFCLSRWLSSSLLLLDFFYCRGPSGRKSTSPSRSCLFKT